MNSTAIEKIYICEFFIAEWPIINCLFPFSILTLTEKLNVFHVADNSSITTESIPTSLIVEPCIVCDDEGTFDYKYYCTEEVEGLNDKNNDGYWWHMLSIDECTELRQRCIDCHLLV